MRPLVALLVMVKDEVANLRATLESAFDHVDEIVALDTGSTDGTQDILREFIAKRGGALYEAPFVDYSTSRNRLLDACTYEGLAATQGASYVADSNMWKPPVFTLFMNADEVLYGGKELRAFLESQRDAVDGAYEVTMQIANGTSLREWPYTRILRTDAKWRYEGTRHERPVGLNREVDGPLIPGVQIVHRESDPARKAKRLREEDLPHFTKIVEDESYSLEQRAHAIFFLAETHTVLAANCCARNEDGSPKIDGGPFLSHQMAAMSLYMRYAHIAEQPDRDAYDPDKVHYALVLYHNLAEQIGIYTHHEMASRMEALVAVAPNMPEARFLLAKHAAFVDARKGLYHAIEAAKVARAAREKPTREITEATLEWRSLHLAAACAQQLKNEKQAAELIQRAIAAGAPATLLQVRKEKG